MCGAIICSEELFVGFYLYFPLFVMQFCVCFIFCFVIEKSFLVLSQKSPNGMNLETIRMQQQQKDNQLNRLIQQMSLLLINLMRIASFGLCLRLLRSIGAGSYLPNVELFCIQYILFCKYFIIFFVFSYCHFLKLHMCSQNDGPRGRGYGRGIGGRMMGGRGFGMTSLSLSLIFISCSFRSNVYISLSLF